VNQRDRQVATLTAAGFTAAECAAKLGISTATVDRSRARQDVQALIAQKTAAGLTPRDVLDSLLYSTNDQTRMKAAVELSKLPPSSEPELDTPLPEGVERIVTRTRSDGTSSVRLYPLPPDDFEPFVPAAGQVGFPDADRD
jgi:hypothetical protein